MYGPNDNSWTIAALFFGLICAVLGWAAIEGVLWLWSHISIGWN